MKILSIDPGSKYIGFAFFENKKLKDSGVIDCSKIHKDDKYLFIFQEIKSLILLKDVDMVLVEAMKHFRNAKVSRLLNEIVGVIKLATYTCGGCMDEVHPLTMKKYITGNGKASKEDVIDAIKKKFKIKMELGSDEADAIGLGWTHINGV